MKTRMTLTFGKLNIRINLLVLACVLLSISGLVRLGVWQLSRAQEKIALLESYKESGQLRATPLSEVPTAGIEFDTLQHQNRRVVLRGEYLNDKSIFLIYQTYESQIGWEVVTPFRLEGQNLIALVSRGWSGIESYEELAANLPAIGGTLDLEGQIFVPTASMASKSNGHYDIKWPLVLRYLNPAELASRFDAPLFPYVIRLAQGQSGVLVRHWPTVSADSGRNFSYALQWFAMAIAVLLVSLILASNLMQLLRSQR
jgi:surfeit locus 1 family protein